MPAERGVYPKKQLMKYNRPDYKAIYTDILNKKFPHKIEECKNLLNKKNLSALNIIELNQKIFETSDKEKFGQ